jgi:carboxymethylenebutenolidase
MRRLGLMGVTGAAASSLLGAFAAESAAASGSSSRGRGRGSSRHGRVTEWAPVPTEEITFPSPRTNPLMGAWAPSQEPRGGVLVIHENRGLTDHIRTVASRLAGSGYSALAVDLLSEEGGTGSFPDEAAVSAALAAVPPERFTADMKATVTELRRRLPGRRLAAIGFCFGGGMVWQLLASGEPRLAAAAPFYGPFPEGGSLKGSRAAVLGVYGGLDTRVNATRPAAQAALEAARLEHELLTFTLADHAFFNDTGARFNPHAAAEAWRRTLNWFDDAGRGREDDD